LSKFRGLLLVSIKFSKDETSPFKKKLDFEIPTIYHYLAIGEAFYPNFYKAYNLTS